MTRWTKLDHAVVGALVALVLLAPVACVLSLPRESEAAVGPLPVGRDGRCVRPAKARWRVAAEWCSEVRVAETIEVPRGVTEMDAWAWTHSGWRHLRQVRVRYRGDGRCRQYAFQGFGREAAWVTCNRDVFGYRGTVYVFGWFS